MVSHIHASNTVVFHDSTYPQFCAGTTLHRLIPGSFKLASAGELAELLGEDCKLLLSFHGPYFPKAAWQAIVAFLERGGNLAIFGGMPFTRPVCADGSVEPEQDTYTRQVYLGPFFQLSPVAGELALAPDADAALLADCPLHISAEAPGTFWSFYPKMTQVSDHPAEMGSAGSFDTLLVPLLYLQDAHASGGLQRVATPMLLLDQRSGRFRGGRWLLSPWQPALEADWLANAEAIQRVLSLTAQGLTSFEVRPALGCYLPGETPTILVTARTNGELHAHVIVRQLATDEVVQTFDAVFPPSPFQQEQACQLATLRQPGLYIIETRYQLGDGPQLAQKGGFWVWDESLVATTRGQRLRAGRDYFYQQDSLFLVYGTTYMDSSVQRKFLHLPNPARWDRDMAEMKAAGVNLIRTGVWTAWREFISVAGVANETFLRALDAFVLTACKHNIQVIFTFFSFFPPLFEGENPWLDPRAVTAQQDFVALLAHRYVRVELLSWDLINEPSFGDPERIFAQRPLPSYDRYEVRAFQRWLSARYTLSELQLHWRQTPVDLPTWEHVLPPQESEYDTSIRSTQVRAMFQVADYTRFSQDMFQRWAAQLIEAIRAGGGQTLVGVGQDESAARIAPQFYAPVVDYTTTHPWWNIDDMLWDMLLDKTLEKPNLIQETGVMQLRDIDGRPWRSEQENAFLLERKLVTGLVARGAGLIQWLWHINSYMTSDNENSIGLVRPDGSAKPELETMMEFGRLTLALAGRLSEAETPPEVWVVIPYSQWFVRPDLARLATQQAVRVLGHDLGVIPQLFNEHQLDLLATTKHLPQTIIVPGLQLFAQDAWQQLLTYVHNGGTLLVNGVLGRDERNLGYDPEIVDLPEECALVSVCRYEALSDLQGQSVQVTFADEKISYVRKAHNEIYRVPYGSGLLVWCGLPLELANDASATRMLYAEVLKRSEKSQQSDAPVLVTAIPLRDGTLFLLVSEAGREQKVTLRDGIEVTIAAHRAGALILGNDQTAQTFGGVS